MKIRMMIAGMIACTTMAHAAVITSGSGSVSTADSTAFKTAATQAYAFGSWLGYVANDEVGVTGSMTLTGDDNVSMNDRVGFVFGTTDDAVLNTGGSLVSTDYALITSTTVAYPGPNEVLTVAQAGTKTTDNLLVAGVATGSSINYAINLKFPVNYADGTDGLGHVYGYTFGFDYDKDGTYEYIESGTFDVYEQNRTRFGFQVQKAPTDTALIFTNDYTYEIYDSYVSIIPEPATLGLVGFASLGALAVRRFVAIG